MQSASTKTPVIQTPANQPDIHRSGPEEHIVEKSIELNSSARPDNNAENEDLGTNSTLSSSFSSIVAAADAGAVSPVSDITQSIEFVTTKERSKRKGVERVDYNKFNNPWNKRTDDSVKNSDNENRAKSFAARIRKIRIDIKYKIPKTWEKAMTHPDVLKWYHVAQLKYQHQIRNDI